MILVTGGAGYIGSHTIKELLRDGREVVALDNLSAGHRKLVLCKEFVEGDLADPALRKASAATQSRRSSTPAPYTAVQESSVTDPQKHHRE